METYFLWRKGDWRDDCRHCIDLIVSAYVESLYDMAETQASGLYRFDYLSGEYNGNQIENSLTLSLVFRINPKLHRYHGDSGHIS